MKTSTIFFTDEYKRIEQEIKELLNNEPDFLTQRTSGSTRAVGDAVQDILGEKLPDVIRKHIQEYSADFARRSMADIAFTDHDGFHYLIDVKTHRSDTAFNMPNLTSVERLSRLYASPTDYFVLLLVEYTLNETALEVSNVHFIPIEFLSWNCLTLGALGWGQIQIANANRLVIQERYPRKKWMLELCDRLFEFYPREISKITERIAHFEKIRDFWLQQPD
jgi:hypothetical protein